jgi:protein tyrosine/serine phosphatase
MRCSWWFYLFALVAITPAPLSAQSARATVESAYGERIQLAGIKNAGKVSEALYRGAQPQAQSLRQLRALGVTTIVNLRGEGASARESERKEAESLGLRFVSIPVSGFTPPTDKQVAKFLAIFREPNEKVFVHCRFGDDRTGVFVATYRMAIERWPAERALKEMYFFGFNGFWHPAMISFVRGFPERLASAPALGSAGSLAPMDDRFD